MRRAVSLWCLLVVACVSGGTHALAAPARDDRVTLYGVGTAHGLGMAMDGIEGQARAGWSYDRILSLFYPGTTRGRASGTIRVGLAEGGAQQFELSGGGTITDAAPDRPAGPGFPMHIAPGTRLTVRLVQGLPSVSIDTSRPEKSRPSRASTERAPLIALAGPANPLDTPPPVSTPPPAPSPPSTKPADPTPPPTPTPPPQTPQARSHAQGNSLRIVPSGDPAVVKVEATGRRYRGVTEVRAMGGTLRVINHVDLETYIAGIAEQRGAGWPIEGLKALAVAARSFAASAMTWRDRSHPNGYDICPTQNCQVYLGYDGEEPDMREAATSTAGEIREFKRRPILAMYHGNGGGQTESYRRISPARSEAYPYLRSIRYPYADPHTWRRETSYTEIATSLRAKGVVVPRPLRRIQVLERGDSPRVVRMRLFGGLGKHADISGTTFMNALDLWSTWFEIGERPRLAAVGPAGVAGPTLDHPAGIASEVGASGLLVVLAIAFVALATATTLRTSDDQLTPRILLRMRAAPAPPGP